MRPLDLQQIGNELAIKWDDGGESFIPLETLRRCCPCAGCKGETDILGKVYKNPGRQLTPVRGGPPIEDQAAPSRQKGKNKNCVVKWLRIYCVAT